MSLSVMDAMVASGNFLFGIGDVSLNQGIIILVLGLIIEILIILGGLIAL